ncbi:PIG-L family deacetylase [Geodermatophilus chilensis]|uniref:PIG-L family deacetylase n=1 Tax=Geodermatophilus chilensis TaxID=2035835 RepID=UPI0013000744|nr:PIG-L family deacetylase [Geodermatophilus chilensis]
MTDPLSVRLEDVVAGGRGVLVLSAHLDDAVLSCGALLSALARRTRVTVVTLFTEAGPPPHTRAARAFLRQCTIGDAAELYAARQQEDADVLAGLGVEHVHLGAPDALFRRREVPPAVVRAGRVVPELVHRYPTFRLDIALGRVSAGDQALVDRLDARLRCLADRIDAGLVLGPVGVGRHVDHLLTRTLAERQPQPTVLYADFPYVLREAPDAAARATPGLTPVAWDHDLEQKRVLIKGYETQVEALFPGREIPLVPETYFLPPEQPAPAVPRPGRGDPPAGHALVMGYLDVAIPLHAVRAPVTVVGRPTRPDRWSRYVSGWVDDPRPDEDALVAALLARARSSEEPTVLFYQSDDDLLLISRRRDELSPALRFVVPEADLVERLVDKAAFQELALRTGLPVPHGHVLDLDRPVLDDRLTFPLLVKPLRRELIWDAASAAKAVLVHDRGQLDALVDALAARHAQVIVQQPVLGPETRIESHHVYVDASGEVAAEFTGRKVRTYPTAMGHSTAVVTSDAPDVARVGREVIEALDLRGVAKLDFKRDDDGRLWLLEVNARYNLWHNVGAVAGVNIPAVVWADLLGLPRPPRTPARPGVAWSRVERDWRAARQEGIAPWRWLRWTAAAETWTPLDLSDPLPLLAGALGPVYRRARRRLSTTAAR